MAKKNSSKKTRGQKAKKVVSTAWNRGLQVAHHAVRVGKQSFRSTWEAWTALELGSRGQCIKFRKELKQAKGGKLSYAPEGRRPVTFILIEQEA